MLLLRYADRLPIGLEKIIRGVSAPTIKAFYERWYRPENMAVVIVGDMEDAGEVWRVWRVTGSGCGGECIYVRSGGGGDWHLQLPLFLYVISQSDMSPPPGADSVAALIAKHLSRVVERPPAPPLPVYTFQPHSQPRCVEWGNGRMHRQ